MNLRRMFFRAAILASVVVAILIVLVWPKPLFKHLGFRPATQLEEFYAWEKTEDGQYRQIKKNYFMNQEACQAVISTLNEMSTKQPRSNWVDSHITESTFECWPAGVKPNGLIQTEIESPYSDDQSSVETPANEDKQKLTPTELFDLRTKCAACTEKVLQNNYPDWMPGIMFRLSSSHYDPKTGRCFVELKVGNIPKDASIEPESYHQLLDGQTGQALADARVYKNGTRTGVVNANRISDFVGTEYYIKKMMGEDAVK